MRLTRLLATPLLGIAFALPARAPAQVNITVRLGNPVVFTQYSPEVYGDWHTSYRTWQPATLYFYNGHYYSRSVRGARPVQMYRRQGQYFLPPQDPAWNNRGDRRFNYTRKPNDEDRGRAAAPPQGRGRGRGPEKP